VVVATGSGEALKHVQTLFTVFGLLIAAACIVALIYGVTIIFGKIFGL
jgi:hypothetical protein